MVNKLQISTGALRRFLSFLLRVLRSFKAKHLLSSAISYYTLLSIVPMSILCLIVLSHFIEQEQLFRTLSTYLEMAIPGYAATLTEQVRVFLEHRHIISIIGFLVMLFFSSIAFAVLENAMLVIFSHRIRIQRRRLLAGMRGILFSLISIAVSAFKPRQGLAQENLALRPRPSTNGLIGGQNWGHPLGGACC